MTARAAGARFPRERRLRDSRDFRRVSQAGGRVATQAFVCLVAVADVSVEGGEASERIGLTVSRRVGSAAVRNRIKRQIREWFRHRPGSTAAPRDLVVIARSRAAQLTRRQVREELARLGVELGRQRAPS